jgi:hypothetical protein
VIKGYNKILPPDFFINAKYFRFVNFFVDIFTSVNYNFYMKNLNGKNRYLIQSGQLKRVPTVKNDQEIEISMLLNAIHYFLDCVFIIHSRSRYRLLAFLKGNILLDQQYTSVKGAKIAFQKFYGHQACLGGIKATWDEYIPESWWLKKKMEILDRKKYQQANMAMGNGQRRQTRGSFKP